MGQETSQKSGGRSCKENLLLTVASQHIKARMWCSILVVSYFLFNFITLCLVTALWTTLNYSSQYLVLMLFMYLYMDINPSRLRHLGILDMYSPASIQSFAPFSHQSLMRNSWAKLYRFCSQSFFIN